MKKLKYIPFFSLAFLAGVLFFSCKKTHDMPPINPGNGTYTIAELRALYNGSNIKFTQDISLYATVTMTDNYKTLYLRDNTGSIVLSQLNAHSIYEGDSIRVNLNGSTLDLSGQNSSLQIDSVDVSSTPTNKVVKLAYGRNHPPVQLSIAQANASASSTVLNGTTLPLSQYDGELVELSGVQFAPNNIGRYIPLNTTQVYITNLKLYDCGNLNSIPFSLYAGTTDFLYKYIPNNKSGSVIGALTFYNGSLQFTPRSYNDMMFTQPRCGVDELTQSFSGAAAVTSAGTFTATYPGWSDWSTIGSTSASSAFWIGGSGYMSAGNSTSTTTRNEMWMITPPIQNSPTKQLSFYMSMANQSLGAPNQLSVLISKDYQIDSTSLSGNPNLGGNAATTSSLPNAIWYDITSSFTMRTGANPASTGTVTLSNTVASSILSGYNGVFYVAFRYRGNTSVSDSTQTVNINNVVIKN